MSIVSEKTRMILARTYPVLKENSEDITYRMYDIFFRDYPGFRSIFAESRKLHPRVFSLTLNAVFLLDNWKGNGNSESILALAREYNATELPPETFPLIRNALLQAVQDVMFDEASQDLVEAIAEAFDCLSEVLSRSGVTGARGNNHSSSAI